MGVAAGVLLFCLKVAKESPSVNKLSENPTLQDVDAGGVQRKNNSLSSGLPESETLTLQGAEKPLSLPQRATPTFGATVTIHFPLGGCTA